MAVEIWPVTESFAAEVGDADLSKPLSAEDWRTVEEAFHEYAVLIFPDQRLTQRQHVDFALRFGPIDPVKTFVAGVAPRVPVDIADVSNLTADAKPYDENSRLRGFQMGNRLWHTDSSFKEVPAKASLLYMRSIPPVGGQTEFADMRAAWDVLPDDLKCPGRRADRAATPLPISRARLGSRDVRDGNRRVPDRAASHGPSSRLQRPDRPLSGGPCRPDRRHGG